MTTGKLPAPVSLALLAIRCGCRVVTRPRPEELETYQGAYRLVDLQRNQILLGERFEASLEMIEARLRTMQIPPKPPQDKLENRVRKLAEHRGYVVKKSRPRLFVRTPGAFQLFHVDNRETAIPVQGQYTPTLDALEAYLMAQPIMQRVSNSHF